MPERDEEVLRDVVVAEDLGLRYEVDSERIGSFKEHVLRRLLEGRTTEELWALRGVSLRVRAGEVLGIFGRNGAGKSTLLRVLARSLTPTEGRIRVRGRVAPLLAIGSGFHPDMTAAENVLLNASLLGLTVREARELYPAIVEFAELSTRMHLPLRQMSSGMVARLGFAVATAVRPELLLVDEVLAVGDAGFQEKCLDRIDGFRRAGTAIVLVSHQARALSWCDRGVILERGRVVASGAPDRLEPELERRLGISGGGPKARRRAARGSVDAAASDPSPVSVDDDRTALDRRLARELVRRARDERSVGVAVRLFAEVREQARLHGLGLERLHQLGPGCLPATLACFLACGSRVADSSGTVAQQPLHAEMCLGLLDLLRVVGGEGWWRAGVDLHRALPMSAPTAFPGVSARELVDGVRLGLPPETTRPTLVFSFGSLGHVPEPGDLLEELARALTPGAGMIHEIDLAHLGFADPLGPLELTDEEARAARERRTADDRFPEVPPGVSPENAYCNRWLVSDWVRGHREAGFEVLACEPLVVLDADRVRRPRLSARLRDRPDEDLRTLVVRIVSRRG